MVGQHVVYVDQKGQERPALVMHEFPHDPNTGAESSRFVNLAVVSNDESAVGPLGRFVEVMHSVRHESAPLAPEAVVADGDQAAPASGDQAAPAAPKRLDYWREA